MIEIDIKNIMNRGSSGVVILDSYHRIIINNLPCTTELTKIILSNKSNNYAYIDFRDVTVSATGNMVCSFDDLKFKNENA